MSPITPEERDAAERRFKDIHGEIEALLASTGPDEDRIVQWRALLDERLDLQTKLDEDRRARRPT